MAFPIYNAYEWIIGGNMHLSKVALVGLLSLASFQNVFASGSEALKEGSSSLSFSLYSGGPYSVQYRTQTSDTTGIYFGVGYIEEERSSSTSKTEREVKALLFGYRVYQTTDKLATFTDMEIGYQESDYKYSSKSSSFTSEENSKETFVGIHYGLEYFVAPQFAVEARAGIKVSSGKDQDDEKSSSTSFPVALIRINYYWK